MLRFVVISILIYTVIYVLSRKAPWLIRWVGKLPGDVKVQRDKNVLYLPFSSLLLISLVLALLVTIIKDMM